VNELIETRVKAGMSQKEIVGKMGASRPLWLGWKAAIVPFPLFERIPHPTPKETP
jgi:transcriptional regulator with XRE-family HTH domain